MTDRMSNERIAELAETPDYWLEFRTAQIRSALRQTSADLAQAEATIAARDAEIARLREAIDYYEIGVTAVTVSHPIQSKILDDSVAHARRLKEPEHD